MRTYFAPLEGITGFTYRNIHHEFFGEGIDTYFTPFIVPTGGGFTKNRSMKDILPENNVGVPIVPQLLSNNAEDFTGLVKILLDLGYEEVNLNLGCPYQTVVSKGRGSGFLGRLNDLERFFDTIFESCNDKIAISVKTRLGLKSDEEWAGILDLYNKYPIKELTVHARTRKEFYKGTPNMEAFAYAVANSKNPLCYNGDIFTQSDYHKFREDFPQTESMMIGRGLLTNPALVREIKGGPAITKEEMIAFHDKLYEEFLVLFQSETNTLFKMKELWNYWQYLFVEIENSKAVSKYIKQIRKSQRAADYLSVARMLFAMCDMKEEARFEG